MSLDLGDGREAECAEGHSDQGGVAQPGQGPTDPLDSETAPRVWPRGSGTMAGTRLLLPDTALRLWSLGPSYPPLVSGQTPGSLSTALAHPSSHTPYLGSWLDSWRLTCLLTGAVPSPLPSAGALVLDLSACGRGLQPAAPPRPPQLSACPHRCFSAAWANAGPTSLLASLEPTLSRSLPTPSLQPPAQCLYTGPKLLRCLSARGWGLGTSTLRSAAWTRGWTLQGRRLLWPPGGSDGGSGSVRAGARVPAGVSVPAVVCLCAGTAGTQGDRSGW